MNRGRVFFCRFTLAVLLMVINLCFCVGTLLAEQVDLSVDDCDKCHAEEPREIAARGAAHGTVIDCLACHESHRPMAASNIPACGDCHEGSPHYELEDCLSCHNPHAPLEVSLQGELKEVCLSCHATPGEELASSPSLHSEVACNFCHAEQHGAIPRCTDCHDSHSDGMSQADCGTCHQAHKPMALEWGPGTPSDHCGACHEAASEQLTTSETLHAKMECNFCHGGEHRFIPDCAECHGMPHAEGMHQKFPQCTDCHGVAHDLNAGSR